MKYGLAAMAMPLIFDRSVCRYLSTILLFTFIIAMMWNVVDLLVMDWIIICRITPKWVVIKGTEGCEGYHDYMYHFKGFLIGCIYTTILSLVISGIDFALLKLIIWR